MMPQTESNPVKQVLNFIPSSTEKETFNPFSEMYGSNYCVHKSKKPSPKISKKSGKCFQLVLICQKLLKPFSSLHKTADGGSKKIHNNHKQKSKSTPQINIEERLTVHKTISPIKKVDTSIQTNLQSIPNEIFSLTKSKVDVSVDNSFLRKNNEVQTEDYWDLDIDSAIVGDYNSFSESSLDEQIDPHYATIKMLNDGESFGKCEYFTDESIFNTSLADRLNSTASSPKSGVYSQINKSKIKDDAKKFKLPIYDYLLSKSNSKLNFDRIMMINNQLGLSREMYAFDHDSKINFPSDEFIFYPSFIDSNNTPDLPKRTYGSSVINFITKLREEKHSNNLFQSPSINKTPSNGNSDDLNRISNIYSPIWYMKKKLNKNTTHHENPTPASEPIIPRHITKTILDHANPIFKDDSSDDTSSLSFYSPLKNKYMYPKTFSETYSRKPYLEENHYDSVNDEIHVDDIRMFRHMDSEVDVSISHTSSTNIDCFVPLDFKRGEMSFEVEDKLFLEPLMERSYEEDYFMRDISSSLDYINV